MTVFPMSYRIRTSLPADTEILGQIHAQAWRETYGRVISSNILDKLASVERRTQIRRDIFAHTTPDHAHYLVEKDGAVVGFGDCGPAREVADIAKAEITTLYLLRHAQGVGAGGALLRKMLEHLADRNFPDAALKVFADNEGAIDFYRHLGGTKKGSISEEIGAVTLPVVLIHWDNLSLFRALSVN